MSSQPTREEILEKYRDRIDAEDFQILATSQLPSPFEIQKEGAWIEYLGPLKGVYLYLKRPLSGPITVIVAIGGFFSGIESIDKYSRIAYDKIGKVVQVASDYCDRPAKEYVIAVRNLESWDKRVPFSMPNESKFLVTSTSSTTTTSTTTTAPPQQPSYQLPSGSGLVPFSPEWPGLS